MTAERKEALIMPNDLQDVAVNHQQAECLSEMMEVILTEKDWIQVSVAPILLLASNGFYYEDPLYKEMLSALPKSNDFLAKNHELDALQVNNLFARGLILSQGFSCSGYYSLSTLPVPEVELIVNEEVDNTLLQRLFTTVHVNLHEDRRPSIRKLLATQEESILSTLVWSGGEASYLNVLLDMHPEDDKAYIEEESLNYKSSLMRAMYVCKVVLQNKAREIGIDIDIQHVDQVGYVLNKVKLVDLEDAKINNEQSTSTN